MAFGLVIDSPITLPEAYPAKPGVPVDVTVLLGDSGHEHPADSMFIEARENKYWWQSMPDEDHTLFNCAAGLFEISNGNEIIAQLYPDAEKELAKIYLLGSAMGAVQIQRGRIPIHGGAVDTQNGAMIITGSQGSGKSTMTSAFVHNGFKYLTDDVSSVSLESGQAEVIPAYPQRKLVRDACAPLGYSPDDLIMVDSDRDKFAVRDLENWRMDPSRLWAIAELYPVGENEKVTVIPITGHDSLAYVMRNLYRMWMHVPGGALKPEVFKKILTIAAQVNVFKVEVPREIGNITGIAEDIASALGVS